MFTVVVVGGVAVGCGGNLRKLRFNYAAPAEPTPAAK